MVIYVLVLAFAAIQAVTVLFTVFTAFKPLNEIYLNPPKLYVINPTIENFREVFSLMNSSWVAFSRYIFNSVFTTVCGVVFSILFASLAAYPLAKMKGMPGVKFLSWFIVLSLMLSSDVSGMTNFLLMTKLRLINTHLSIIIPAVTAAFNVFLLKQFMEQMLPDSLIDAAKIDGAGEIRIWRQIALPVIKPAIFTLAITSMQSLWNNPGVHIYDEELKTLPAAMQMLVSGGIARSGHAAAVGVMILVVPLVLFIIFQSNVIETMSTSGIKD